MRFSIKILARYMWGTEVTRKISVPKGTNLKNFGK